MAENFTRNELALWGGVECTINRVQQEFFDQLQYSGHYNRTGDIEAIAEIGIKKIRYPILWEKHQPDIDTEVDWRYTEERIKAFKAKGIDVIAGLVHHGSGPSYTNLLDPQFPYLLADYAKKVAQKFPDLNFYTPVNEPLTTARFSGLYGLWYPHKADDHSFLTMLLHEIKGTVLSMQAIRNINPAAKLIQTEDLGKTYSTKPLRYQAELENKRRWLTYDLLCGKVNRRHPLWRYFTKNKIKEQELEFFIDNPCVPDVFGFNHYLTSERFLDGRINRYPKNTHGGNGRHRYADVEAVRVELKEPSGLGVLLKEAWDRYAKPIAVTEVHLHCHREEQLRWFKQVWASCQQLKEAGVAITGVTAWAMLGSYGWNKLLTEPKGDYEPGVFDVSKGVVRPTALAAFIKGMNKNLSLQSFANEKGWWQRNDRFFQKGLYVAQSIGQFSESNAPLLIIGKNGTLGRALARLCKQRCLNYKLLDRQECNICDEDSIELAIGHYKPWAIINAAGFVRVDDAESESSKCFEDNTNGAHRLAIAAARHGIKLVTFSTDLVFDGDKGAAYVEEDAVNPLNVYGKSKAEAEGLVLSAHASSLVIRTSAFFSPWDEYNFVHYVRRSLMQDETISVARDAIISPTYVPDLVNATLDLLIDDEKGIWHLASGGELSWVDLANEVADRFRLNRKYINAVTTEELRFPARRPLHTALTSTRGILLPTLEDALKRYTKEAHVFQRERQNEFRA